MRAKHLDNFRAWRDQEKQSGRVKSNYPPLLHTEVLAYLYGFILGDGHIEKHDRTEKLIVTLNDKYPILVKRVAQAIEEVFGKKATTRYVDGYHGVRVYIYERLISRRLGIPTGNKCRLVHAIPGWINSQRENSIACLKGLFEAEGSLCVHRPTYTHNFAFANTNESLLDYVYTTLMKLGLHPERRRVAVRLRRKNEVEYFRNLIKFRE